ncbi:MAG: hypothetical protein GWP91_20570, partial [Rhodobacterales bacterium]|nr:hypothetical protein [Rhodobacterales bacterium]
MVRLVALLALSLPLSAYATDLYVGPAQPYLNVEDAIAAAVSGDTIYVEPGVYDGVYDLDNMSLSIIGIGEGEVVLQCSTFCTIVLDASNGGDLVLENITIDGTNTRGGVMVNWGTSLYATDVSIRNTWRNSAIHIANGYAELTGVDVSNATIDSLGTGGRGTGAGISVYNSTAVMQDVSVLRGELLNSGGGRGGCLSLLYNASVTWDGGELSSCTIDDGHGGAIYVDSTSSLDMSNTEIQRSTAQYGGAVACDGSVNCTFSRVGMFNNHAEIDGGAIWLSGGVAFDLQQSRVCLNDAALLGSGNGGGLWVDGGTVVLKNNLIGSNVADQGAGVYLTGFIVGSSENNNYVYNTSAGYGMAIYAGASASLPNKSDLIAFNTGDTAIYQVNGIQGMSYSDFYANVSSDHNGAVGGGVIYDDPDLVSASGCLYEHQVPEIGSPLIDAGYWLHTDYDGSPADIGMFGGQGSLALEFYDQDHDGYVLQDDCDDLLDTVHPDQDEYCDELNIDDNCNGLIDNADTAWQNASQLYPDTDGDGAGDYYASSIEGCPTVALVANADDCFDGDPSAITGPTYYADADSDGYGDASAPLSTCVQPLGFVLNPDDCDDSTNLIGLPTLWYADFDGDGHGTPMTVLQACEAPLDYVASLDDCDDNDGAIFPGAVEVPANGVDNDCDGLEDCYVDFDQDGYGNDSGNLTMSSVLTCLDAGVSASMDDCSDGIPAYHPDAIDGMANGFDENCDGVEDCWEDLDLDLYGSDVVIEGSIGCNASGEADIDGDCDDSTAATYPGATEIAANGVDEDCDTVDHCFTDGDGDTYGSVVASAGTNLLCNTSGESATNDDCDDGVATINPGAPELPVNGVDENCDGLEDCYVDGDG